MIDWKYIHVPEELATCVEFLRQQPELAIDLEFDKNRYRYGFNLCLVQIYAGGRCFLIDPLGEGMDLSELYQVLEDPAVRNLVYSFGEDMRLLHSLGCFPKNTYDLAIVLRLLDYPPASLASVLVDFLDIEISKAAQKSNWFSRPLSNKQLDYAARDVLYLFELNDKLQPEVEKAGVKAWIEEEHEYIDILDYSEIDNNVYLKEKDKHGLSEHEYYIYEQLMGLRESLAKKYNRPSYQVIDKEYLRELAQRPNQIHRFEKIRGIYKALKTPQFKDELWANFQRYAKEAEQQGLSKTEDALKRLPPEEYRLRRSQRKERDEIKKKVFKPIQAKIAENQGEQVVTYIMGNRLMEELAEGRTENLRHYKRQLIEQYAKELGIDVSPYLGT
jgi:ribonuclease D